MTTHLDNTPLAHTRFGPRPPVARASIEGQTEDQEIRIWEYRLKARASEFRGADTDWRMAMVCALTDQLTTAEWAQVVDHVERITP